MGEMFICTCGAVAECHPHIAGHLQHIECPACHLATPAIDTATMEGTARLVAAWERLGGSVKPLTPNFIPATGHINYMPEEHVARRFFVVDGVASHD